MYVSLFVFMVFLAVTHAEEPLCSKFSYDEALLEKMIRTEFKLEQLQEKVEALLKERKDEIESLSTPIIVFKATGVINESASTGEVLVFPTVLSNTGNGYKASTGIFTAPVDGLYLFTTQICTKPGKSIAISIKVDEMEVGTSYSYDSSSLSCNTGDAMVVVNARQNVCVKIKHQPAALFSDSRRLMSFSGALLHKEH